MIYQTIDELFDGDFVERLDTIQDQFVSLELLDTAIECEYTGEWKIYDDYGNNVQVSKPFGLILATQRIDDYLEYGSPY